MASQSFLKYRNGNITRAEKAINISLGTNLHENVNISVVKQIVFLTLKLRGYKYNLLDL